MKSIFLTTAAMCAALISQAATPAETLVTKARTALGGETALNAVRSLRIEMSVVDADGKALGALVSEYKAPYSQRELNYTEKNIENISAINGREGFRILRRLDNNASQIQVIPYEELNARRDFTAANLHLLAVPSTERGSVELAPDETIDGVACATLDYSYASGVIIRRYVDKATGRLVATRINNKGGVVGNLMLNVGEQKISEINFPKSIVIRDDKGKTQRTLNVTKVEVNPSIDDAAFAMPRI